MNLARLAVAIALSVVSVSASALAFKGSFEGIAHVEPMLGGDPNLPASYYDGSVITGTFSAYIADSHLATYDPSWYFDLGPGGRTNIQFNMRGRTFSFDSVPSGLDYNAFMGVSDATPEAPHQSLYFHDSFYLKYQGSSFTLSSPPETLFQNGDITTLSIGPDTVAGFDAYFKDSNAFIYVDIDIHSFSVRAVAPPVPEPPLWALMGCGLALAASTVAVRSRR